MMSVVAFLSRARIGSYDDAIALADQIGGAPDTAAVRRYTSRGGVNVNLGQQVADGLGVFGRAGIANGNVEPYEFADIDRTASVGASFSGKRWGRPDDTFGIAGDDTFGIAGDDTFGIAGVVNGISSAHQAYLNAGGLGILVGDGRLPHPGLEQILKTYYSFPVGDWRVTADYQLIVNPAYNHDRGPVSIIGTRLHMQF
jgi:high affinity Mn2+ porin